MNGLHLCDWQLVYQGTGEIHLPCSLCYGVIPSTARDNKYNIRTYSASGKNYLEIKEQERISCFGLCGNNFFNRAGAWCEKSCLLVEIGGGAPVGSHGVEIHTLPVGSAPAGCVSRWCDNILHLVQSPVMSCNCITGYKLI